MNALEYLESGCRIIIDEVNLAVAKMSSVEVDDFALERFHQADLTYRIGHPFRHLARYVENSKANIIVDHSGLSVATIYLKPHKDAGGNIRNKSGTWKQSVAPSFEWLFSEIDAGKKGQSAMIIGWFTRFDWAQLIQFGANRGKRPRVNQDRIAFFPFLFPAERVSELTTMHNVRCGTFFPKGCSMIVNWALFGSHTDHFNIVVYY